MYGINGAIGRLLVVELHEVELCGKSNFRSDSSGYLYQSGEGAVVRALASVTLVRFPDSVSYVG